MVRKSSSDDVVKIECIFVIKMILYKSSDSDDNVDLKEDDNRWFLIINRLNNRWFLIIDGLNISWFE